MAKLSVAIGSDHAGYSLKSDIIEYLSSIGYNCIDDGCYSEDSVDYPDFAHSVATKILSNKAQYGILICGTGIGISISANRHNGIRAALCNSVDLAKISRQHNNANILVFGARVIGGNFKLIKDMIDIFLSTEFEAGRHQRRVEKIDI